MRTAGLTWDIRSETGPRREHNEDSAAARLFEVPSASGPLPLVAVVVADGMGGLNHGEVASRLAVEALLASLASQLAHPASQLPDLSTVMRQAVAHANATVYRRAQQDEGAGYMGTTLTAALIAGRRAVLAQVGDSRAYLIASGQVGQLTHDHSVVQEKVDADILTPLEARRSTERNQITRALGLSLDLQADLYDVNLPPAYDLLLTSDGAHGSLIDSDFTDASRRHLRPGTLCQDLLERAKARDGSDNLTLACVRKGQPGGRVLAAPSPVVGVSPRRRLATLGLTGVIIGALILGLTLLADDSNVPSGGGGASATVNKTRQGTIAATSRARDAASATTQQLRLHLLFDGTTVTPDFTSPQRPIRLRVAGRQLGKAATEGGEPAKRRIRHVDPARPVEVTLLVLKDSRNRITCKLSYRNEIPLNPAFEVSGQPVALTRTKAGEFSGTFAEWPVKRIEFRVADRDVRLDFVEPKREKSKPQREVTSPPVRPQPAARRTSKHNVSGGKTPAAKSSGKTTTTTPKIPPSPNQQSGSGGPAPLPPPDPGNQEGGGGSPDPTKGQQAQ